MADLSNLPPGAKVIRVQQQDGSDKYQAVYQVPNGTSSTGLQTVRLVQQTQRRQIALPRAVGQPQPVAIGQQGGQSRQVIIRTAPPGGQRMLVNRPGASQSRQVIVNQTALQQAGQPRPVFLHPGQIIRPAGQSGQVIRPAGQSVVYRVAGPGGQTVRIIRPGGRAQGQTVVIQRPVNSANAQPASSGQVIVQQGTQYVVQSSAGQANCAQIVSHQQAAVQEAQQSQHVHTPPDSPQDMPQAASTDQHEGESGKPPSPVQGAETDGAQPSEPTQDDAAAEPQVDVDINNVVCSFSTRCHLNLKRIATEGANVIYKRENGMVNMKLRKPRVTATIWSSGKITCTGATSEESSKVAARRVSRILQKMGFRVRFCNFRVVNVLGTCSMPWDIRITNLARDHRENTCYEPELHPGLTYRIKDPKATLKVFTTGSITVTAPRVANVGLAIEHIYPLVYEYRMEKKSTPDVYEYQAPGKIPRQAPIRPYKRVRLDASSDEEDLDSEDLEDLDSD